MLGNSERTAKMYDVVGFFVDSGSILFVSSDLKFNAGWLLETVNSAGVGLRSCYVGSPSIAVLDRQSCRVLNFYFHNCIRKGPIFFFLYTCMYD